MSLFYGIDTTSYEWQLLQVVNTTESGVGDRIPHTSTDDKTILMLPLDMSRGMSNGKVELISSSNTL
jgi:hypothetical protein